jgi:hypothetical protein
MVATTLRRLLTADEYQRMAETGILNEDERVELLGGEMYIETATGRHPRHLSADDYQRMVEMGILDEDERIELIGGEMYHMAAIGARHANAVRVLNRMFNQQIGAVAIIDVQNPIRLDDESLPQTDILVLRDRAYPELPTPTDTFMVVEVGDSSRDMDKETKFPRYAVAGIAEAWLVDLVADLIARHSEPRDGLYRQITLARAGDTLTSTVFPQLAIPVDAVLGMSDMAS